MNSNKEINIDELVNNVLVLKKQRITIGLTNGCFDLLHKGHIHLLTEIKKKCDYLIVAINSDKSVKLLKGNDRPVNNEKLRISNLSKLSEVDSIIVFIEDNPLNLIKKIIPDILFKGSDYKEKTIVGREFLEKNGNKVVLIDNLKGYSTTNIINNSSI